MKLTQGKGYAAESIQEMQPLYYEAGSKVDPDLGSHELLDWFDSGIYIGPDGWGM